MLTEDQGWGPPEWITEAQINKSITDIGFNVGYRNMCRFFSGFFWKHPSTIKYDYLWRLDVNVEFRCDIHYDPFMEMKNRNRTYAFSTTVEEAGFTAPSLWPVTKEFIGLNPQYIDSSSNMQFISNDGGESISWRIIYNNFEISHRSVWESEAYSAYFDYLDRKGGFYTERWGDAPIHSIAISLFMPKEQSLFLGDTTGYIHDDHPAFCPKLPWCSCNSTEDFDTTLDTWNFAKMWQPWAWVDLVGDTAGI